MSTFERYLKRVERDRDIRLIIRQDLKDAPTCPRFGTVRLVTQIDIGNPAVLTTVKATETSIHAIWNDRSIQREAYIAMTAGAELGSKLERHDVIRLDARDVDRTGSGVLSKQRPLGPPADRLTA